MITLLKSFCIAFSTYSKIPMPQFAWEKEDMKYSMIFFPFVGAVIGLAEWGWYLLSTHVGIGRLCFALVGAAIPILISGGIHIDGFMDTVDALSSYQSKEKKLEILSDPHIGAFAVIAVVVYALLYVAGYSELFGEEVFLCYCGCFYLSRILSAISVLWFPCAKENGMLSCFSKASEKWIVTVLLGIEFVMAAFFIIFVGKVTGVIMLTIQFTHLWCYYIHSNKMFGGVTGDLAGFFVSLAELLSVMGCAFMGILMR